MSHTFEAFVMFHKITFLTRYCSRVKGAKLHCYLQQNHAVCHMLLSQKLKTYLANSHAP